VFALVEDAVPDTDAERKRHLIVASLSASLAQWLVG
jgi:hypothetical protein